MLPFFNYIIFTKHESNYIGIKDVLKFNRIEDAIIKYILSQVTLLCKQYNKATIDQFFFFHVQTQKFYFCTSWQKSSLEYILINRSPVVGDDDAAASAALDTNVAEATATVQQQQILNRFHSLTAHYSLREEARILFSLILTCLDENIIRLDDLSVVCGGQKRKKRISLVDFCTNLLSNNSEIPVELKLFFQHLSSKCVIPSIFIRNKNFL